MSDNRQLTNPHAYPFPGWQESWGIAPAVSFTEADGGYIRQLLQQLGNLSEAARLQSADNLRVILKGLSGQTISFRPSEENAAHPASNTRHFGVLPPYIEFNPDLWERYPAEDATQLSQAHWEFKGWKIPPVEHVPDTFSAYGFAPPEQLLLRELAQYAEFNRAYLKFVESRELFADESLLDDAEAINRVASNEKDAIVRYENPGMRSAIPGFIARNTEYSDLAESFSQTPGNLPKVSGAERHALEVATRIQHTGARSAGESGNQDRENFFEAFNGYLRQKNFSQDQVLLINQFLEQNLGRSYSPETDSCESQL